MITLAATAPNLETLASLKLSIVIATHARPTSLARLIESLSPQLRPESHEVIIAENGTPAPVCLDGARVIHLHDPLPGKCRIQNRALVKARGELIACLDDDLIAAPDYIAGVEDFFEKHREFAAMKGRILPQEDPSKLGPIAPYLDLPLVDHGDEVTEVRGVLGANMAFRAWVFKRVGPFDERLGPGAAGHEEETEMSERLRLAGLRIGYAPRALVYHEVDAARADRARFIRIARERGYCRTLHEFHSPGEVALKTVIASTRLVVARALRATPDRIAREERRLAVALGMRDGLRSHRDQSDDSSASRRRP
jgi:GT2 family glycosyltransferase